MHPGSGDIHAWEPKRPNMDRTPNSRVWNAQFTNKN